MQGDAEALKPTYESLESLIRQSIETLKKIKLKGDELETCLKKCTLKWENLRKMYNEFLKSYERDFLVRIASNISSFQEDLKQLFTLACCDSSFINYQQLPEVASVVGGKLLEFSEFLSVIWKDKSFNYAYFLWFEDKATGTSKSIDLQKHINASQHSVNDFKSNFEPGLLADDYYHQLKEACFPKTPANKITCFKLYCIHLGLVTATCVVEHARRLVANISDVGDDMF